MLYIIGLGLNEKSLPAEGKEALKTCKKAYLESYTVDFPYSLADLEKNLGIKITKLARSEVESDFLIKEAKKENIALLVYGSPLFATTHTALLADCKKAGVKARVILGVSVFDAIALSGLQPYKFGRTTSMPKWQKNFTPDSFMIVVEENQKIKAHTLILCDIGLSFSDALNELEISAKNRKVKLHNIAVCSQLGTEESKVYYNTLENLKKIKSVKLPFCLIIPSDLHFTEKEALENQI